jgi:hypothetical protein
MTVKSTLIALLALERTLKTTHNDSFNEREVAVTIGRVALRQGYTFTDVKMIVEDFSKTYETLKRMNLDYGELNALLGSNEAKMATRKSDSDFDFPSTREGII